jgi:glycosyltransferase involved in cell wall biosynthesis
VNILLSIHHYMDKNAGAPGVTYRLAEEYRRLGHNVELFSFDELPKDLPESLTTLLYPQYLHARCRKLQREGRLDVIDASSGDIWFHLRMRQRDGDTVAVTRSHGLEHMAHEARVERARLGEMKLSWKYPIYHGGYRLWEVAQSFRQADGAVLLNKDEYRYAADRFGLHHSRVIGNGVPDYLLDLPLAPTPLQEETPIGIAFIGSYIPRKGTEFAANGLAPVLERYPNAEITFLGTQCPPEKVHADYDPRFHSRIHVVPRYEHSALPELLAGHQILLFPSLSEGMPLSLLEAMACGLAPVASLIPGPNDIISHMDNGLGVPARDGAAITEALGTLLVNRELLHQLRTRAWEKAQDYSWRRIAEDTLAYYEHCAERKADSAKLRSIG